MPCDNSNGVFGGILGECPPIDLGCIPLTSGQPPAPPTNDELPIRYDQSTGSLWIYRCNQNDDSGTWEEIPHETLCDAPILDPTGIPDICDLLFVPVTYAADGNCCGEACEERRIEMDLFSEQVKSCLDLRRVCELDFINNAVVDGATTVQLAACVDGVEGLINPISLCRLPSMNNATVDGATTVQLAACVDGAEVLINPISLCRLDVLNAGEVDAAGNVLLAACVDGVEVLIPRFTMCRLSSINQAAVDAAASVELGACVDGNDVLIPYPPEFTLCGLNSINQAAVDAAASVELGACVDGNDVLIPYPPEFTVCGLPPVNQEYVDSATNVRLAACVDGNDVLIPRTVEINGTWTPVIEGSTTAGVFSYSKQVGEFTIIGDNVFFYIQIQGTWTSPPTGNIQVSLPIVSKGGRLYINKDVRHSNLSVDSDIATLISGLADYLIFQKYDINGNLNTITDADQVAVFNQMEIQGRYIKSA